MNKAVTRMDEGTQQNAAMVEEAASAAESLSEEAQHLDGMMANYQIASGSGSQGPAMQSPVQSAVMPRPEPGAARSLERRSGTRPWGSEAAAGRAGSSASTAVAATAARRPAAKAVGAAGGGGDPDWTEF